MKFKEIFEAYKQWLSHNYFTLTGIIIILSVAWYVTDNTNSFVLDAVDDCNNHWHEQIKNKCPLLSRSDYYNIESLGLIDINVSTDP